FLAKDGYNIIGVIQGNTLFNATRILDKVLAGEDEYVAGSGDEEEGRLVKITGTSDPVGMEPVDEGIKPAWREEKKEVKKKKKRKAVNDAAVLSFGGDDDEEEGEDDWKAPAPGDESDGSSASEEMSMVEKMRAKYTKSKSTSSKTKKKKKDKDSEVMAMMESFKESVKKAKQRGGNGPRAEAYFGQVMEKGEDDSEGEGDWREGRFDCKKHIDHKTKMAN
ncbi:hypothetical protein TrRE_jg8506, partial [Triparma retinervis]